MRLRPIVMLLATLSLFSCATRDGIPAASPMQGRDRADAMFFSRVLARSTDAASFVEQCIRDRKILFLPEKHSTVNPILFLAENLPRFHAAGLRYLFLEAALPKEPSSPEYGYLMFLPWTKAGCKYESSFLSESISRLNATVMEGEKLQVIYAERGLVFRPSTDLEMQEFINLRDSYAAATIRRTLDQSIPEAKAIVLYGGSHGSRIIDRGHRRDKLPPFDWKPLGAYLSEAYGEDFLSFWGLSASDYGLGRSKEILDGLAQGGRAVATRDLSRIAAFRDLVSWDYCLVDAESLYGTYHQYVPRDENLRSLFLHLRSLEKQGLHPVAGPAQNRSDPIGQYLLCIYYLKLYFGSAFEYDLWNPRQSLRSALDGLEAYAFAPGMSPSAKIISRLPSLEAAQAYHRNMFISRIEPYLLFRDPRLLPTIIRSMEESRRIFPEDLWSSYWLCYGLTKTKEYRRALDGWDRLLAQCLAQSMENLPRIYSLAAECATALGLSEEAEAHRRQASALQNEHGLAIPDFGDL